MAGPPLRDWNMPANIIAQSLPPKKADKELRDLLQLARLPDAELAVQVDVVVAKILHLLADRPLLPHIELKTNQSLGDGLLGPLSRQARIRRAMHHLRLLEMARGREERDLPPRRSQFGRLGAFRAVQHSMWNSWVNCAFLLPNGRYAAQATQV